MHRVLKAGFEKGIPLNRYAPANIAKTAITTPFGLFEYRQMTFGLYNAGNMFQRFIDRTLAGMPAAFAYLDVMLIASPDHQQHESDLRGVLQRLPAAGLVLKTLLIDLAKDFKNKNTLKY